MNQKITMLVGNGFNYFINNYIKNPQFLEEIINNWKESSNSYILRNEDSKMLESTIKELSNTMSVYCELLNFIELEDYETKGETLLSSLEEFVERFDKKSDNPTENFLNIEYSIKESIKEQFKQNACAIDTSKIGFLQYVNAQVKFAFKYDNEYFAENLNKILSSVAGDVPRSIYTTNYDYITESVFTECYGSAKIKDVNFYHLHGHYIDESRGEIICCSPNHKKNRIEDNDINKQNFESFMKDIKNSSIIILFGIGLTSDPHILAELNEIEGVTFIIIDNNKEEYFKKHLLNNRIPRDRIFRFLRNNDIYFIDTLNPIFDKYLFVRAVQTPKELGDSISDVLNNII